MQGFNMGRYVPPEHEGTVSANKIAGKHALGNRASKLDKGILTVRFEMPFPIWCTTCQPHPVIIGQGVRFNAEKKKIGNYYSTPIYSFRMKHSVCGGWIDIHTDPKNTAYVVVSGAKKRDTGEDKDAGVGEIVLRTAEEREKLEIDPFAALDVKVEDQRQALSEKTRIEELKNLRDRDWCDPYEESRKLRRVFRAERKAREEKAATREQLKDRMGLGIELLEETEEDRRRAGFVEFERIDPDAAIARAKARPLFALVEKETDGKGGEKGVKKKMNKMSRRAKAVAEAEQSRERLGRELRDNTRAAMDPFLVGTKQRGSPSDFRPLILGVKRKRTHNGNGVGGSEIIEAGSRIEDNISSDLGGPLPVVIRAPLSLVDYESD